MAETPHNIEAEQAVLGALLLDNDHLDKAPGLDAKHFFDPVHADIFSAIKAKINEGKIASPVTIKYGFETDQRLHELGGVKYLARLAGGAISTFAVADYATVLIDLWSMRTAMAALEGGLERFRARKIEDDAENILAGVEAEITEAVARTTSTPLTKSFGTAMMDAIGQINTAYQNEGVVGVPSGLMALDKKIGGFSAGELIILAGRPSMGKSAVAFNIATKAALRGDGVFFASLEMDAGELAKRFFSQSLAGKGQKIPYFNMRTGRMDEDQFRDVILTAKEFSALPVMFGERECRRLGRLRSATRRAQKQLAAADTPMKLIVVDYLQLVEPEGSYRGAGANQRVSDVTAALKALAGDFGCPVIALSQLNREVERRDPPIPMLADLRDSGSIEQDADVVMFCYRGEYYTEKKISAARGADVSTQADLESLLAAQRHKLDLIIAKQRNGPTSTVSAHFDVKLNFLCDTDQAPATEMEQEAMGF